jgi:beta-xylosidase
MSHQSRTFTQLLCLAAMLVASLLMPAASARTSDNGNGSFTNPVLYADYPDPDIIRVGGDFYMVTTTFVSIPGLEILHSNDLINWNICEYAVSTLDFGPKYSLIGGSEYGGGVWAPSIRYHDGTFYIIDNIQSFGTVVFRATNPAGPWGMTKLNGYLFDPGLLFDDDGTPLVYNGTGGHISVAVLDDDLKAIITNTPAYTLPTGEGSHAYKIKGTYYVFNSVFGQFPVLLCSKSTSRTGPFTTVTVCDNHVPWASPHQGGIVQLANGDWWGFSLVDSGAVGRDLWEGPVNWRNGFPYLGNPEAPSIPLTNPEPDTGPFPVLHIPSSDDFVGPTLGLQWQWNHNPDDSKWSLSANPGKLRLYTELASNYSNARNTLTLRTEGPTCSGEIKIDVRQMQPGDRAGLSLLEQYFGYIAVFKNGAGQSVVRAVNENGDLKSPSEDITDTVNGVQATTLWFKVHCDFRSEKAQFSYSTDGLRFTIVGGDFPMHFTLSTFQGDRFGIFNYNPDLSTGWIDVDFFHESG